MGRLVPENKNCFLNLKNGENIIMKTQSTPKSSTNLELIRDFAMNNKITHGEFRQIVQAIPQELENSSKKSALEFVVNEFASNQDISNCEFRRLVQVSIYQTSTPTSTLQKLKEKTGVKGGAISQALGDLERKGLLKKVKQKRGAYIINTNKDEWFPKELSTAEIALQNDLDALEQLRIETVEKMNAIRKKQNHKKGA